MHHYNPQDRTDRMIDELYRIIHQTEKHSRSEFSIERLRTAKAVLRRLTQEQKEQHHEAR
jgi:hypothetical protein